MMTGAAKLRLGVGGGVGVVGPNPLFIINLIDFPSIFQIKCLKRPSEKFSAASVQNQKSGQYAENYSN
jgi:hypothetical protein